MAKKQTNKILEKYANKKDDGPIKAKGSAGAAPPKWYQYRPPFKMKEIISETGKKLQIKDKEK